MAAQPADAAAIAQQIGNAIAAAVAPAAPAGPPAFALTPALANAGLLDYSKRTGADIYKTATASLPTKFTVTRPNLRVLTNEFSTQARSFGWQTILTVGPQNLLVHKHYNALTAAVVVTHVETYIDTDTRDQQNDYQVYVCLNNTVDEETKKYMASKIDDYTCGANDSLSGVLYLKTLLAKSAPQAKAIATQARDRLTNLQVYMKDVAKDNITDLHQHVDDCIADLTSVNQDSADIEAALFRAYALCGDENFRNYMDRIQDEFEADLTNAMTYIQIMDKADNRYKTRKSNNTWNQLSTEQAEIHALRGQIEALTKKRPARTGPRQPATPRTPKDSDGKKTKFERLKPEWRKTPPATGQPHKKIVDGVEWDFCKHHGYWVKHTSEECSKNPANGETQANDIRASMADVGVEEHEDTDEE